MLTAHWPPQVFYESGILKSGAAAALFKSEVAASISLDWPAALQVSSYEWTWGSASMVQAAAWTRVDQMEDVYKAQKQAISAGPLLQAMMQVSEATRSAISSLIAGVLAEREASAYSYYQGQMSKARATMWLLARNLKDEMEGLVPGLRPAEVLDESEVRWVPLLKPAARGGASAQAADEPTTDGEERMVICTTGRTVQRCAWTSNPVYS